jgi:hypothetical protein
MALITYFNSQADTGWNHANQGLATWQGTMAGATEISNMCMSTWGRRGTQTQWQM